MKVSKKYRQIVFLFFLVIVFALVHLYIQNKSISLKYGYAKEKVKFQKLYDQNRYYSYLASKKGALNIIEEKARRNLGMDYPENITYIIASEEAK